MICKNFFPLNDLSFHFILSLKCKSFWWIQFIVFFYMKSAFGIIFKEFLPNPGSERFCLLEQESANYSLQTTSGSQLVIVHLLLKHSCNYSFTYSLWLLSLYSDSWVVVAEFVWPRQPKIFTLYPPSKDVSYILFRHVTILALIAVSMI